jgi:hypothetical protein
MSAEYTSVNNTVIEETKSEYIVLKEGKNKHLNTMGQ